MVILLGKSRWIAALAMSLGLVSTVWAATPTVEEALSYQPVQKDVQVDRPAASAVAKCTLKPEKAGGKTGWVVRDAGGQVLRNFVDTNGDNVVDQWSFYKDGVEIYRDIDSNFNRKPDQCRWLNMAGTRWGIDADENGKIDFWKSISAEEATYELVAAIRDRDRGRFDRVMLGPKELKALGLGAAKTEQLQQRITDATAGFLKLAGQQKVVTADSKWVSFGGSQPGVVPAGTDDSTADLTVYESVMAMIETDGKAQAINVGALVRVKDAWRLVDLPQMSDDPMAESEQRPFFFAVQRSDQPTGTPVPKQNEEISKLLEKLNKLGDISPDNSLEQHNERATLIEQLAQKSETPDMRANWYRQLADSLAASVQTGGYTGGIERLKALVESLKTDPKDEELAFYAQFRFLTAEHTQAQADPNVDFPKVQTKWKADLESFIESAKKHPDSADAMLELAIAEEFGGDEEKALKWYTSLVKEFPSSPMHRKAEGARLRLSSVGKPIPLKGKTASGQAYDLNATAMKGKVVLIQYWATWCESCKSDMPLLKDLRSRFKGFEVVGVCLNNDKKDMAAFMQDNPLPWPQLFEDGGLDSRYAVEMGIQTLPMMILVDKDGKVVNRNIHNQELEAELKKLLR